MEFPSWLSTCSIFPTTTHEDMPSPKPLLSDESSSPSMAGSSSITSQETTSSDGGNLHTNLSLLTLPSIPSLQKYSPDQTLNLSITTHCVSSLKPHHDHVNFLAVNKNLLYTASGNVINVFDIIIDFTLVDKFNAEDHPSSGSVKSIAFSDEKIFTAHQDCKIRVWKLTPRKQHKLITTLPTFEDRLRHALMPKSYAKVRKHKKKLWLEHHDAVSGLAMAETDLLCSVSWDRSLKIWNAKNLKCIQSVKAHDDAINAVVVSVNGTIYTASADRKIKVWERPFGEKRYVLIATMVKHKSAVNALALSNDGSLLFSGSNDRSILVWEREDSADYMVVSGALRGHEKGVLCLVMNACGLLFSGSADRTVRIWQQQSDDGKFCCLTVLDGHERPVRSLVVVVEEYSGESDGCVVKVFSGSLDGEIKLWQVVTRSNYSSVNTIS